MGDASLMVCSYCDNDKERTHNSNWYETFHDRVRKTALQELREDEKTREKCLKQFKEWISRNRDIENCVTDDNFLLRFLRVKKYSLLMAQELLLNYLRVRTRYKYMLFNLDYLEPNLLRIVDSGHIIPSPIRDKHGRRVIITTARLRDSTFTGIDIVKVRAILFETIMDNEEDQVLGVTHVFDFLEAPSFVPTDFSFTEYVTLFKSFQKSAPIRLKEFHIVNVPTYLQYILNFAMSLTSQKMQDRVKFHTTFEQLHTSVDPCVLPLEHGGKMPLSEMVHLWKIDLAAKRDRLLSIDKMILVNDGGLVGDTFSSTSDDIGGLHGSFRALEID